MLTKISITTIEFLAGTIADKVGDLEYVPLRYLSGPKLVNFFNEFGYCDKYSSGFSARKKYVTEKLNELNNKGRIKEVVESFFAPQNYINQMNDLQKQLDELNKYLYYDDFLLKIEGKKCVLLTTKKSDIVTNKLEKIDHDYIKEHIKKCDQKFESEDYSGAINNAKSVTESLLNFIRNEICDELEKTKENPDLPILYKQVAKKLNLDQDAKKSNAINQIL